MINLRKKSKLGEYPKIEDAMFAAKKEAFKVIPIFLEPDGTYSINEPSSKRATIVCGIDGNGSRYKVTWTQKDNGEKIEMVRMFIQVSDYEGCE